MANSKNIIVTESELELNKLIRQQPIHKKNRIQMLLILKKNERSLSKKELAAILKVNHNTAQKWRKACFEKGIDGLLPPLVLVCNEYLLSFETEIGAFATRHLLP